MFKYFFYATFIIFIVAGTSLLQKSSIQTHNVVITKSDNLYEDIKNDGAFKKAVSFGIVSLFSKVSKRIILGEYKINYGETAYSVLKKMFNGERVIRKITFPEGYTVKMIIEKLMNTEFLTGDIKEIPEEGSLMPDTYFYEFGDDRSKILKKMENQMNSFLKKIFSGSSKSQEEMKKVIVLASVIEKETSVDFERSVIASVYLNRLKARMRLQSCPTIIYAVSEKYGKIGRKLTKKDLSFDSPYNTYAKSGLPPTPICCPGRESIIAALNPAETDFLYFVADGSEKSHHFSKNYEDHLKYKKRMKEKQKNN